jgi:uncharacterized protein (TIGR02246 family)
MKHPVRVFVLLPLTLLLLGIAPAAWAGAAEEVAEIVKQRAQWGNEGNVDAMMTTYADNAVLTAARLGLRFEGKDAIRTFFTNLWQAYPKRTTMGRHSVTRFYANETVAVVNGYGDQIFVDRNGQVSTGTIRNSTTLVKTGGKWLVVDQHNSRLP